MTMMMKNNMINFVEQEEIMTQLQIDINKVSKKYIHEIISDKLLSEINGDLEKIYMRLLIQNKLPRIIDINYNVLELNKLFAVVKDKNSLSIETRYKIIGKIDETIIT